jgi:hypothetical protein
MGKSAPRKGVDWMPGGLPGKDLSFIRSGDVPPPLLAMQPYLKGFNGAALAIVQLNLAPPSRSDPAPSTDQGDVTIGCCREA